MVTFTPIERSLDVLAQEWRVYKVEQIEAADDIVVFPQSLTRLIFSSIGDMARIPSQDSHLSR
jgi:hypothetical protein